MLEKRIEIFRIKAGILEVEPIGKDEFAFWSRVRWNDCLFLGEPVARVIEEYLGFEKGSICTKESFEYLALRDKRHPCISFFIPNSELDFHALGNGMQEKIQQLIAEFLNKVVDKNNLQLNMPEIRQEDPSITTIAEAHACGFLRKRKNVNLETPLQLESFSLTAKVTKGFLPKPPFQPKDPEKFELEAQVVLLGVLRRKCILFACEKETEVVYNANCYFSKLKNMLGEVLVAKFVLEKTWDAAGREQIRIDSMGDSFLPPDMLI